MKKIEKILSILLVCLAFIPNLYADKCIDDGEKVKVEETLYCANWNANYDGCGKYDVGFHDSGWNSTSFDVYHDECKSPVTK